MAKTKGNPNESRRALLDASRALLAQGGFEAVGVNSVIEKAGLSKGTFYYWFKSKEDLLDAVAEDLLAEAVTQLLETLMVSSLDACGSFRALIELTRDWRFTRFGLAAEAAHAEYREEHGALIHKMERRLVEEFSPVLAGILEQGRNESIMQIDEGTSAEELAEYILLLGSVVGARNMKDFLDHAGDPEVIDRSVTRVGVYYRLSERLLGMTPGSLGFDPDALREQLGPDLEVEIL